MSDDTRHTGAVAQQRIWEDMADVYMRELEARFAPVVRELIARADLRPGDRVLDLGTGTGAAAASAARLVAPGGTVVGIDISHAMLERARQRMAQIQHINRAFLWGRAESIPADDAAFDVVLASLSLMFVPDRAAAAREIARVLRPGGRIVATVWDGPERCDIVRFQQTAGRFAPDAPTPGVGPGALADPTPFLAQLAAEGIVTRIETVILTFEFGTFSAAWDALAGVTAASLRPERSEEARAATQAAMGWDEPTLPRQFRNAAHLLNGTADSVLRHDA